MKLLLMRRGGGARGRSWRAAFALAGAAALAGLAGPLLLAGCSASSSTTNPLPSPAPVSTAVPSMSGPPPAGPKILIVGDSITTGMSGDYTWRYRLWQDLTTSGAQVQFVGHRTGTEDMYDDPTYLAGVNGTGQSSVSYANPTNGYYHTGIAPAFFTSHGNRHDSLWGWSLALAKNYVAADVAAYKPDYLLVELGFDDLSWERAQIAPMLADDKAIIDNARAVDPGLRILLGNLPTRVPIAQDPWINPQIRAYNSALAAAVPGWSTIKSPVKLVDIGSGYAPATDTYDGLHPNGIGEYVIADAFAAGLAEDFRLGKVPGPPPSSVPGVTLGQPTALSFSIAGSRLLLSWGPAYGATEYLLRQRDITGNPQPPPAFRQAPYGIFGDHLSMPFGAPQNPLLPGGHSDQFEIVAVRGNSDSAPSTPITIALPATG